MKRELIYSALKTPDQTILESNFRHDYKQYIDKNGKIYMIDGGLDYIKSSTNGDEEYILVYSDEPHYKVREFAFRSGYGKDSKGEFRITRIKDMSDDYLKNSIKYVQQYGINSVHLQILLNEIDYRKENNIKIDEK